MPSFRAGSSIVIPLALRGQRIFRPISDLPVPLLRDQKLRRPPFTARCYIQVKPRASRCPADFRLLKDDFPDRSGGRAPLQMWGSASVSIL